MYVGFIWVYGFCMHHFFAFSTSSVAAASCKIQPGLWNQLVTFSLTCICQWWAQGTTDSVVALAKSNSKNLFVKNERQGTWEYVFFLEFCFPQFHCIWFLLLSQWQEIVSSFSMCDGKPGDYAFNSTLSPFRVWLAFSNHRSRWRCIVPLRNDWKIILLQIRKAP